MAGRFSVEGTFRVVDRMSRPVRQMGRRVDRFANRAQRGLRGVRQAARDLRGGFLAVGAAIGVVAAGAVSALREVIRVGRDFDATMAQSAARFGVSRSSQQFADLEAAAREVGGSTEFMAQQASEALSELAAAGVNARDAVVALPTIVDSATASGIELGRASEVVTDQLNAFGLATDDAAQLGLNLRRVSDVMTVGSQAASHTYDQLTGALGNVAAGAHSAGVSLEETVAMIDVLAAAGEKGERAGSRLNAMLRDLRTSSERPMAVRALRRLGVAVRDASGALRPMRDILRDFESGLDGMNDAARDRALGRIFTDQGLRPMQLLLGQGSESLVEFEEQLRGAQGATERLAGRMRDSAGGDIASMNSALESLQLSIWELIRGPVRSVVQAITEWVRTHEDAISGGLGRFMAWIQENQDEIAKWGTRFAIAVGIITAAFAVVAAVVLATALAIPAALAAIVAVAVAVYEWIRDITSGLADSVTAALATAWDAIRGFFRGALEFVVGLFVILRRIVAPYLQPVLDAIAGAAAWVRERWAPIGQWFAGLWRSIAGSAGPAWNSLMEVASGVANRLRAVFEPIREFFAGLWESIAAGFGETLGGVIGAVSRFVSNVRGVGADELDGDAAPPVPGAGGQRPQVVSQGERVARSVSETTRREQVDVRILDEANRAEVTRTRPTGPHLALQRFREASQSGSL